MSGAEFFDAVGIEGSDDGAEIQAPKNFLSSMVLDVISNYGNMNVPPPPDPYKDRMYESSAPMNPAAVYQHRNGRLEYGSNYLTHDYDFVGFRVSCVYLKTHGVGHVLVDEFKAGGGFAARTYFKNRVETPDHIIKTRETKSAFQPISNIDFNHTDFSRKLISDEVQLLRQALWNPSVSDPVFRVLIGVSKAEKSMTEASRRAESKRAKIYYAAQQSAAEAAIWIRPRGR